ncbi:hypothetical protein LX95_01287 [Mesonia algae]|uniref:Uncharacterized protein n=1 Tax=Mesonia algae TaxID=213248 RepID=A0A2W7I461_9FLAO|nr:hypothetical protein [Mesonia algae]PZW41606.1 hypothetical protein LX95_01287 [Mesonia algae]
MKVIIDLDLDTNGKPCISIKHYDKSKELQEKLLGIFLEAAIEKGLKLHHTNGMLSEDDSWEKYEIRIN